MKWIVGILPLFLLMCAACGYTDSAARSEQPNSVVRFSVQDSEVPAACKGALIDFGARARSVIADTDLTPDPKMVSWPSTVYNQWDWPIGTVEFNWSNPKVVQITAKFDRGMCDLAGPIGQAVAAGIRDIEADWDSWLASCSDPSLPVEQMPTVRRGIVSAVCRHSVVDVNSATTHIDLDVLVEDKCVGSFTIQRWFGNSVKEDKSLYEYRSGHNQKSS